MGNNIRTGPIRPGMATHLVTHIVTTCTIKQIARLWADKEVVIYGQDAIFGAKSINLMLSFTTHSKKKLC